MGLSTHVLDTALGRPARDVGVQLALLQGEELTARGTGVTDADGRCKTLLGDTVLLPGIYRLRFDTASYFRAQNVQGLYPFVDIVFAVDDATQHFHIPLLLTPNGYTTYRGS